MFPINFLRFRARPPSPGLPPENVIDAYFDPTTGKIIARNNRGEAVSFDGAGGASSTADLTTSDGSADAAAGKLGEYFEVVRENGLSLTDSTEANVTSVALTAGDWDVSGSITFIGTGATSTERSTSISRTSAGFEYAVVDGRPTTTENFQQSVTPPVQRMRLSAPATIYLVGYSAFSAGTITATGRITARRVR